MASSPADALAAALRDAGVRRIAPTDIAQFIRLEQCERYLRLRLHERAASGRFPRDYGVAPQAIPPLLTRSGATFEQTVEATIARRYRTIDLRGGAGDRPEDNARVLTLARDLPPGETLVLLQPRLQVEVAGWWLRGDVDLLRLERDASGALHALIADLKSSTSAKIEHRLQVAFYHEMLTTLFNQADLPLATLDLAILYRGPASDAAPDADAARQRERERDEAERLFGTRDALLERVADVESYRDAVRDLVLGGDSTASRVLATPFEAVPYHLSYKCDGCLYNELCMKWSAERDDLSLLPHLTANEKSALQRHGVASMRQLAALKAPPAPESPELVPAPGEEDRARRLAATWPVGPRLDELIHRARRYRRWQGDALEALSFIPSKGYGSLPYSDAGHNPNLIRVYIDAQHDYLHDRIYLLGALVVAREGGREVPERRRSIVHLTARPPHDDAEEAALFLRWTAEVIDALGAVAAPNDAGEPHAPIHLIFYDSFEQRLLLAGLARHFEAVLGATPLYDFITQLAAFDSPVATFLDREIRELKNYPMVCQSLQAVAAYLRFDWNQPERYRELFRARLFDFWGKLDTWYTNRARFGSQLPLEYAYAAWGELPDPPPSERDDFAPYRAATPELLRGFQARRLEALEWIARDFPGNRQTQQREFDLSALPRFQERARTLAQALDEFVTIERHVALADWKSSRLAPPERRALGGTTLLVRYLEADQAPDVADHNRENLRRHELRERYRAEWRAARPEAKQVRLPKEQQEESAWSQAELCFRLRLDLTGLDCRLDELLGLTTFREGDYVVLAPRWTVDTRLPSGEQAPFTPTPRQLLYGQRATLNRIVVERDAAGRARAAWLEVTLTAAFTRSDERGFVFGSRNEPLRPGECYTVEPDPNDWHARFQAEVTAGLLAGGRNTLYDRLVNPDGAHVTWHPAAHAGQARFLAGLDALRAMGALHGFEPSKREFIGARGETPTLLVQGPPGTGKSYATAFALFARLQGALAADQAYRVCVSCKTHAATDVLLKNVVAVQERLRCWAAEHPAIFADYFDRRLLDLPLFRAQPKGEPPAGSVALPRDRAKGTPSAADRIVAARWCVVAATPGGIRGVIKERWPKALFGHAWCDCLVLDEASQLNLPEALLAALPLKPDGHLIVVGDHRQMPPIVKHDWENEQRRTFRQFRSYESLFLALLPHGLPTIKFAESFRLHADMAEFLRREIYYRDGIAYHSHQRAILPAARHTDPFVASVLAPEQTIVVVVHDETGSQQRNAFERRLIAPVLAALADPEHGLGLGPVDGLGVVVPHRAQRAALREALPQLVVRDPATGAVRLAAVDTVERFQGDERRAILISATESDRQYLLASSEFLLDPRRLTVALSRAKEKLVLVASRAVFELFSADEETFAHARLWKQLLRRTCTTCLWTGERHGHRVEVWGNRDCG